MQVFLASQLGISKGKAKELIDSRSVFVNRRRVWMARHTLQRGDTVEIAGGASAEAPGHAHVIYEDDAVLVVNKPAGMLANGPESVESALREQRRDETLTAVHRLDRETSGCLMFAKKTDAGRALEQQFLSRDVGKRYRAIVAGRVEPARQVLRWPVEGQPAVTRLFVTDARQEASYVRLEPETGRTHQLRIHMKLLGHPVIGDKRYGTRKEQTRRFMSVGRQMLHAWTIEFVSPADGKRKTVKAPLPGDFRRCLQMFRLE